MEFVLERGRKDKDELGWNKVEDLELKVGTQIYIIIKMLEWTKLLKLYPEKMFALASLEIVAVIQVKCDLSSFLSNVSSGKKA